MDDEAFLDDEIYDDDSPDHHPVDDDDLGVLGGLARPPDPSVDAPDLQPASCFTPEYLAALAGTDNLEACTFLEMRADTTDEDLSGVGRLMPALSQLRLSNSVLPEMRAFGSAFQRLTVLWIARSRLRTSRASPRSSTSANSTPRSTKSPTSPRSPSSTICG